MKMWKYAAALAGMISAAGAAHATTPKSDAVKEITAIENQFCVAQREMNVDKILALYQPGPDFHLFDMMLPREYKGTDALRKNWEGFFQHHAKSIDACEVQDLVVQASGDLAFARFIGHAAVTAKDGKQTVVNTRMIHIFRNIGGKWLIVHEHASFPLDWATGQVDFLSKP